MLALSPPLSSTFGWPLEDSISHEHNNTCKEVETYSDQSFLLSPPLSQPLNGLSELKGLNEVAGDGTMAKKLNHNASERDRRKKINSLYSSLRSLLPTPDQTKKLSIPATVSRVLKYIPELQREVERLVQKKEELMSRINSRQEDSVHLQKQRKRAIRSSLPVVSATPVGDREVVIQICTVKEVKKCSITALSEVLQNLEEDGLLLLNASCFESLGERVFYNLHLQVRGAQRLEFEMMREKLLSMYEKRKDLFP